MNETDDTAPLLGTHQVDQRLVDAIQDGCLRQVLRELSALLPQLDRPAQARVAEAADALAAIDAAVDAERLRLVQRLTGSGVGVRAPLHHPTDRPLHIVTLRVARPEVPLAAAELERAGYRRLGPAGDAAWRAFRAVQGGCTFVAVDGADPFRVELRWAERPVATRGLIGRLLTPNQADFDAVTLPVRLWPVYTLVHVVCLTARRFQRRREPPDLGPFLSTPTALIEPLLRFADLSSDDVLVDLGSGDGRIPIAAATVFGCRARGVETDAVLVTRARARVVEAGLVDRVDIICADLSGARLDDAGVVVAFLPVETVEKLLPSILDRLPGGARLVAHEQQRLRAVPADVCAPLISPSGISVAHRWNR